MLIPSRPVKRVDVPEHLWNLSGGTHFNNMFASASASSGWTYTGTPTLNNAATGDFNSSGDHTPVSVGLATVASAQSLRFQTRMFGSYAHWSLARDIIGYPPTKLCYRVWASFPINSANESHTGFGFVDLVAATTADGEKVAWFHCDGTNILFREDSNTVTTIAKDTSMHEFIVKVDATNMECFVDGTSYGTLSTPADTWPVSWQANGAASRTNRVEVSHLTVWYE